MEARHIELERFAKKAQGYKLALSRAPDARSLELYATAAVLRGHFRKQGRALADLRIVDLMAGSGYLGEFLKTVGFQHVWALEASPEMASGVPSMGGLTRIALGHWEELSNHLEAIRPDAIIAMAGFHHLMQHEGKTINKTASVVWQFQVVNECARVLDPSGIVLIVDLIEPGAEREGVGGIESWDARVFDQAEVLPEKLRAELTHTASFDQYCSVVSEISGKLGTNPTLRWFRDVVNPGTQLGHDDVALSRELVQLLRCTHAVKLTSFPCPWVFRSRGDAGHYVFDKFGFGLDAEWTEVRGQSLLAEAERANGVLESDGRLFWGWNLGAIMVQGSRPAQNWYVSEANTALVMVALFLLARAMAKALIEGDAISDLLAVVAALAGGVAASQLSKAARVWWTEPTRLA